MHALIVEDDRHLSFLWEETLEEMGYDVEVEASCAGAMQQLLRKKFNIVVMDFFVEDSTTANLADWIKMRTPDVPVVVLTGSGVYANGEHTQEVRSADWFLRKPVTPSDLGAIVTHLSKPAN